MAWFDSSSTTPGPSPRGMDPLNAMYASMAVSSIGAIGTSISQANALKAQGAVQEAVASTNAKIASFRASQALEAGDIAASRKNLQIRGVMGAQRAAAGASGTDVNTGSNLLNRISIQGAGAVDELTIRNNAAREAWGYKTQAIQDTYQGKIANMTAATEAQQTILTGGLQAISGPLAIEANYLRFQRYMHSGGGTSSVPFSGAV